MRFAVLPLVTFGLLAMVVADRVSHALASASQGAPVSGSSDSLPAAAVLAGRSPVARPGGDSNPIDRAAATNTPTIDRLARLAARQHLTREGRATYLDSLIVSTDSLVRRWPDRNGTPLKVCVLEGGPPGYQPRMVEFIRTALNSWEDTGIGVRFSPTSDSTAADIVVRWIDHFDFDRAGQTDLTWDRAGRVRTAAISLALRTNTGFAMPDAALRAVAVHETGHALGLPHSSDSTDVMFPATKTSTLSERDRRTAQLLYQLPVGPLQDLAGTP
ncbi:MAG: matrixin family metalloprotease [Gemmatimonadales bacterium]